MELLAPAGTIDCFNAAIDAGADAVYLGLTEFNARMRAKNFTAKTLSYLVPYAHERKTKIYVTFNTLIKQFELKRAIDFLFQIEQIGVDAVILQDIGIAEIVRSYFPKLKMHASTQMSVHNSLGLKICKDLGFRRVVVARELSLFEIEKLCSQNVLEIEIFCHGALCYSVSGMCLASSFFGGASGNRGRCTQVCRRKFFTSKNNKGYFFSPRDLCTIDYLQRFAKAGVTSLKIEGRMKSPHYVYTVVSAYKLAINQPHKTEEAKEILLKDLGRNKTTFFLEGEQPKELIERKNPQGTGIYIGKIEKADQNSFTLSTKEDITTNDIIRIQPQNGYEGIICCVKEVRKIDTQTKIITLDASQKLSNGDFVYLIGTKLKEQKKQKFSIKPILYKEKYPNSFKIIKKYENGLEYDANRDRRLFVKINNYNWLYLIDKESIGGIICAFNKIEIQRLINDIEIYKKFNRAIYIEPPPYISENEIIYWQNIVNFLCLEKEYGLMCSNLSHIYLGRSVKRKRCDYMLWCLNKISQVAYNLLGCKYFAYSLEDDVLNIRDCASQNGMIYLFTHVPLFISKIKPEVEKNIIIYDDLKRRTVLKQIDNLYYLIAQETVCLFHKRKKLEEMGINLFCIDLSFIEPDKKIFDKILYCYQNQIKYEGSCLFNFKGGLK